PTIGQFFPSRQPIERTAAGRTTLGVIGRRVIAAKLAESCFDAANHAKIRAFTRKRHFGEALCSVRAQREPTWPL
ncbi:hypothetical protein ACSTJI_24675, partial [Vibrio parahaemolyticus]